MEKSRRPGVLPAARLFSRVDEGDLSGFISATTVTTIHCLARGTVGDRQHVTRYETCWACLTSRR